MDYKIDGNRAYIRAIKRSLKKNNFKEVTENKEEYFVSSSKYNGKYCIEFRNFKGVEFFNKILTTKKLLDCQYYPPSLIIKNKKEWDKLKLNDNKYYYIKPKYGGQCKNISVTKGKQFVIENTISYPFALQEEITPKLFNNKKIDYRIFVLYIKHNNNIHAYYSPQLLKRICQDEYESRTHQSFFSYGNDCQKEIVEIKSNELENCLKDAQRFIIPKFNSNNISEVEYFISGYDLIEDTNGKFWIMEINWDPNFYHYDCETKFHQKIFKDITQSIITHKATGQLEFNYFLPLV